MKKIIKLYMSSIAVLLFGLSVVAIPAHAMYRDYNSPGGANLVSQISLFHINAISGCYKYSGVYVNISYELIDSPARYKVYKDGIEIESFYMPSGDDAIFKTTPFYLDIMEGRYNETHRYQMKAFDVRGRLIGVSNMAEITTPERHMCFK